MIVSVHVPKCAGTSFRNILDVIFGDGIWHNYGTIFTRDQAVAQSIPARARAIHGHFIADAFDDLFPKRRLITWVRDPVERVVSNYYHCLRAPDMRDDCCRIVHEQRLGLLEFADLDWMKNLSERFDKSIEVFSRNMGFTRVMGVPRLNVNPKRLEATYGLSREERSFILERNGKDLAWYEQACLRLDAEEGLRSNRVA